MANLVELRNILFKNSVNFNGINNYWKTQIKKDPFLKNVFMTIDLVFGDGSRYSYATDLVTVTNSDGDIIVYEPALQEEPMLSTQYSLGESQASLRTFTLTIDGRKINALDKILRGEFLTGIAEVSLQVQNGIFENRIVIMRGEMSSSINFGEKEEMVELQISDIDLSKDKIIPEHIITEEDFEAIPDEYKGYRFPIVKNGADCGIPCIRTSNYDYGPTFIVCYGHDVIIKEVSLNGISVPSNDLQRGWEVKKSNTASGIPYTSLAFVYPSDVDSTGSLSEGVAWSDSDSVYALIEEDNKSTILSVCKLLLIQGTTLGSDIVDEDLFSRAESKLPYLSGDFVINGSSSQEATKAIEYVQNTVLPNFPMLSLVYSNNGIGVVAIDRNSELIVNHYIIGNSKILDRSTGITEKSKGELYNSFTLRYAYNSIDDTYTKTITKNSKNSMLCKISENRLGKRDYEVIDSIVIKDDSTAEYVLEWLANHLSLPSYYIEYECVPSILFDVKIGDNLSITDDRLNFYREKATIEKIEYSKGKVTIGLRFWLLYNVYQKTSKTIYN